VCQRKFSEISNSLSPQEAGEVWGGALWEIRNACGQDLADKMFYNVWSQVQVGDNTQKIGPKDSWRMAGPLQAVIAEKTFRPCLLVET
jgi:hypothetical protein